MQPAMTTAEWLRRAADAWSEADATQDQEARRIKIILAEGYERLAKHAAFLAEGNAYPSVGRLIEMAGSVDDVSPKPRPTESLVRGLVALLATPFLLLAALGIALWIVAPRKQLGDIPESPRRSRRWWLVVDIATALLGVATLDWLVDAF
jgi:hypothetical protein